MKSWKIRSCFAVGQRERIRNWSALLVSWLDDNDDKITCTIHAVKNWKEGYVIKKLRSPKLSSTNSTVTRVTFGNENRKLLPILSIIDSYNISMNGVDSFDQRWGISMRCYDVSAIGLRCINLRWIFRWKTQLPYVGWKKMNIAKEALDESRTLVGVNILVSRGLYYTRHNPRTGRSSANQKEDL